MALKSHTPGSYRVRDHHSRRFRTLPARHPVLLREPKRSLQHTSRWSIPPPAALAATGAFGEIPRAVSLGQVLRQARQAVSSPHDKEISAVAFPVLIGMALEPAVNAFNAGLVGHLGTQQLSAVSLSGIALNSATFLFSFLMLLTVPEVATAAAKNDPDEVSRVTAQSLWLALGCGIATALAVFFNAGNIVAALKPPEPMVAELAHQYFQIRAVAIPAVMLGYVTTGVFRGFKDTRTPLLGTAASVGVSFCLHVLLLNVFHLGVVGAAVAASVASLSSCVVMIAAMLRGGKLQPRHLVRPPSLGAVLPILQRGAVLGARNVMSFGMIMFASAMCIRMGSAFQASFEVIRQIWMLSMPLYECVSVAGQSLCAAALGQQDRATARALLLRLLALGMGIGGVVGAVVWALHGPLTSFFTSDPEVVQMVLTCLPLICACFPLDAAGSIMDGSLMAAKQSNYLSAVQIIGSAVQYAGLMWVAGSGNVVAVHVWIVIKIMSLFRVGGGLFRNFLSAKSAYRVVPAAPAPAPAAGQVQPSSPPLAATTTTASTAAAAAASAANGTGSTPSSATSPSTAPGPGPGGFSSVTIRSTTTSSSGVSTTTTTTLVTPPPASSATPSRAVPAVDGPPEVLGAAAAGASLNGSKGDVVATPAAV